MLVPAVCLCMEGDKGRESEKEREAEVRLGYRRQEGEKGGGEGRERGF